MTFKANLSCLSNLNTKLVINVSVLLTKPLKWLLMSLLDAHNAHYVHIAPPWKNK
jgi:hypothetical protein